MATASSRAGPDRRDSDRRDFDRRDFDRRNSDRWEPDRRISDRRDRSRSRSRERDRGIDRDRDRDTRGRGWEGEGNRSRGRDRGDERDQGRDRDIARDRGRDGARVEQHRDDYSRNVRRPVSERVSSPPPIRPDSAPSSVRNGPAPDRRGPNVETSPGVRQQAKAPPPKGSAPPPAPSQVSAPTTALLDQTVRCGVDTLCERLFWYMQRERADAKFKKIKFDVDRCKSSFADYASAYDVLLAQKDAASQDRDKCCARVDAADQKVQKLSQSISAAIKREIGQLIVKSGALESDNKTAKTSHHECESERAPCQSRIAELEAQLLAQKAQNEALEKRLESQKEALEKRLERLEAQHVAGVPVQQRELDDKDRAQLATIVNEGVKDLVTREQLNHAVEELDMRLSATDMPQNDESSLLHGSAGERTGRKLASMEKFIQGLCSDAPKEDSDEIPACIRSLMASVSGQERAIREQIEHRQVTEVAIEELRSSLVQTQEKSSAPETQRQSVLDFSSRSDLEAFILSTTKEPLKILSANIGHFLDAEKAERLRTASEVKQTASSLAKLETECEDFLKTQNERQSGLASDLASLDGRVGTVDSRLAAIKDDSSSFFDELQLQIKTMQAWQNNFTTRQLHDAILGEMNKVVPNGYGTVLQLKTRVESIENRLRTDESCGAKRRKTDHEGPLPSDGGHVPT
ncbi:hypothetical protein JDV02_006191 [Purpureocillium takamizusanense]|uniref:Uncharacterized protein n=1 Tax=Purpureocillium takamizusanense TaxID=2060973 RepID=A0A9Q8QI22_9HYPO|nr:uncharacterized protein JDV02_006191 [Purpureocillium takamizusanense]UNI20065.1 hypothetical protein JDV02_006191 [Purpureocillium takamizusanense]